MISRYDKNNIFYVGIINKSNPFNYFVSDKNSLAIIFFCAFINKKRYFLHIFEQNSVKLLLFVKQVAINIFNISNLFIYLVRN